MRLDPVLVGAARGRERDWAAGFSTSPEEALVLSLAGGEQASVGGDHRAGFVLADQSCDLADVNRLGVAGVLVVRDLDARQRIMLTCVCPPLDSDRSRLGDAVR
jgi:hypothetical protein